MAEEVNSRSCPQCGTLLPQGTSECPQCGKRWALMLRSRETVLGMCVLLLIIFFFFTGMIVQRYHQKRQSLGAEWFAAGQEQLKENNAPAALADFRNSLVYKPDDSQVQFQLAEALSEEGRNEEARSYLLGLLGQTPADAQVNLALARIAASSGSEAEALRYYHGAIYGIWPANMEENRLNTRLELCRFLIAEDDPANADSELIALEAEIPRQNGMVLHEQTGELFFRAGDANRALEEFRRAMEGPHPPNGAVRGAGLAAFRMGDYRLAERYLERADRKQRNEADVETALETARLILAWNPESPRLTDGERRDRVRHDLAQVISRVELCAKGSGVDLSKNPANQNPGTGKTENLMTEYLQAKNLQTGLSDRDLARHPERLDAAVNMIFELEATATRKCGEPTGLDEALEILDRNRQNVTQ